MLEEELIHLRQEKNELQEQVNLQKKLIEQQQDHIKLLEEYNRLKEQQIKVLTEEGKALRERLGKHSQSNPPLPSPDQFVHPTARAHKNNGVRPGEQENYSGKSLWFSSPPVVITLILLVLLLIGGGSIGVYDAIMGHLPWTRSTLHGPSALTSPSKTAQVNTTGLAIVSSGPSELTVPGLFTIVDGPTPFFWGQEGVCVGPVLASDRLTYTNAELQDMYTYFNGNMYKAAPPKTLKMIEGGSITNNPNLNLPYFQNCPTGWEMTNIGHKPIQLVQVGMKLLANATVAAAQYRLVDFCSVLAKFEQVTGCPGLGGQTQPISYTFSFGPGNAGSIVQGQSTAGEPVINPGQTLFLQLGFSPATPSIALTYTIEPEFVINTSQDTSEIIDLPQWETTFVMAPASHFGCYVLQGSTFVSAIKDAYCF